MFPWPSPPMAAYHADHPQRGLQEDRHDFGGDEGGGGAGTGRLAESCVIPGRQLLRFQSRHVWRPVVLRDRQSAAKRDPGRRRIVGVGVQGDDREADAPARVRRRTARVQVPSCSGASDSCLIRAAGRSGIVPPPFFGSIVAPTCGVEAAIAGGSGAARTRSLCKVRIPEPMMSATPISVGASMRSPNRR